MSELISKLFETSRYITHPFSLIAYVAALILFWFVVRNVNARKKIESVPEGERAALIKKLSERLDINLTDVPENKRAALIAQVLKNRIYSQLIGAFVIIAFGIMVSFLTLKYFNLKQQSTDNKINRQDSLATQNAFSIKGIQLEGEAVTMFADSAKLSKDWNSWFGGPPILITSITDTYDTLEVFKKKFSYNIPSLKDDEQRAQYMTVSLNEKIRSIKIQGYKSILAVNPNNVLEYGFTASLGDAEKMLDFDKECYGESQNDPCITSINQKMLNWIVANYSLDDKGVKGGVLDVYGEESAAVARLSNKILQFYSYLSKGRLPRDFIFIRNNNELSNLNKDGSDACGSIFGPGTIKYDFSTPFLTIDAIVIKNESDKAITIDHLDFLYTDSIGMRTRKQDLKSKKKKVIYFKSIKLPATKQVMIPTKICLNTLAEMKTYNDSLDLKKASDVYYYGKAYYLDSITVNGFRFPVKQAAKTEVLRASLNGKWYDEGGSCPYLYTLQDGTDRFLLENHFLYKKNKSSKEGYDTLHLKNPSGRLMLAEIDEEISFIDHAYILEKDRNGIEHKYALDNMLLAKDDKKYMILKRGTQLELNCNKLTKKPLSKYFFISKGYYQPFGKSNRPPSFLLSSGVKFYASKKQD